MSSATSKSEPKPVPFIVYVIASAVFLGLGLTVLKDVKPNLLEGIDLSLGKTSATIGVILLFFPLLRTFYYQPLKDAIEERTVNLERTFSEAESLRAQMTQMREDYERRLKASEDAAREQIQQSIQEAQKLRQDLMTEAAERADELVKRAQEEIAHERDKVLTELRMSVVDLTLRATEQIIGEKMTAERDRQLVEEFIEKVEVKA